MGAVADQIKNNQKMLQNASGGMDEATRDHIRNLDVSMNRLIEETNQGNKQLISELRSEIKILAKTVAVTVDSVSSSSRKEATSLENNNKERAKSKSISAKRR